METVVAVHSHLQPTRIPGSGRSARRSFPEGRLQVFLDHRSPIPSGQLHTDIAVRTSERMSSQASSLYSRKSRFFGADEPDQRQNVADIYLPCCGSDIVRFAV